MKGKIKNLAFFANWIFCAIFVNTTNPIPPRIIRPIIIERTYQLPEKPDRESGEGEKPALQKAEIERKIELKIKCWSPALYSPGIKRIDPITWISRVNRTTFLRILLGLKSMSSMYKSLIRFPLTTDIFFWRYCHKKRNIG